MNREKQVEYCKKCTKQKFDFQQGIICSLTNEKADFENECENFEIDHSRVESVVEKKESEKKGKVSFGFSPKQDGNIIAPDLTKKEALVLAHETAKNLNWDIGFLSDSGFRAYSKFSLSSWGEEIQVSIEVGNVYVKSECTGSQFFDWGKNKRNVKSFIANFNTLKDSKNELDIEGKYSDLGDKLMDDDSNLLNSPLSHKENVTGLLSLIIPTKGYFITPIIAILNVLLFGLMVATGVNIIEPTIDELLLWGANFRQFVVEGEWWRLLSSLFIHIGVLHLIMNMYALVLIGLFLEPIIGKARFLIAYILTGIVGSVASFYWHEFTVSAGASGAIFGMYGVFLALLSTKLIDKSARKSLLISIGIFVLYNLMNGINKGVDNAAHLGGLLSGALIGYAYYPGLAKPRKLVNAFAISLLTLTVLFGSFLTIKSTDSVLANYDREMEVFYKYETEALALYSLPQNATDQEVVDEIRFNGLTNWKKGLSILEDIDAFDLPINLKMINRKHKEYVRLRIRSYELILKMIEEETQKYDEELENCFKEIDIILSELYQPY